MEIKHYLTPLCYVESFHAEGIVCASDWTDGSIGDGDSHNMFDGVL